MSEATRHILSFRTGLADLRLPVPFAMHTDNTGPKFLAVNPSINARTKHISVYFLITREAPGDTLFVVFKVASVTILLIYAPNPSKIRSSANTYIIGL